MIEDYMPPMSEAALERAAAKQRRLLVKRAPVRLYYKTPTGKVKTRDFLAWLDNGIDDFRWWYGSTKRFAKRPANLDKIKTLDGKALIHAHYMPARCKAVKLVQILVNGTEKLVMRGQR